MSAILNEIYHTLINEEITHHSAWIGHISGLKAEKILRGFRHPYLYLLRRGEYQLQSETDYYVTYVSPDFSIKHTPFVIAVTPEGWYFENHVAGGPYSSQASIDDVIHLIMHCEKEECTPMIMPCNRPL